MKNSNGPVTSVKVPVRWESMTENQRRRLERITSRDTRVIRAFLGVIERHEPELLVGRDRTRIDISRLTQLTMTACRGKWNRPVVEHDFKKRFPNASASELNECLRTAHAMWQSHLATGGRRPLSVRAHRQRKIPRYISGGHFRLVRVQGGEPRYWLRVVNSLTSAREGRARHDHLMVPLSPSSYHLESLSSGTTGAVRLVKDSAGMWWAIFAVRLSVPVAETGGLPVAVMGIDLGIKRAVCSVVLTRRGLTHVRYWTQRDKVRNIARLDRRVASLQRRRHLLTGHGSDARNVTRRLRAERNRRERVSIDHDRKLVRSLAQHISELLSHYDLYIALGRVRGIRTAARKRTHASRYLRGAVHRWSYYRITFDLRHKLAMSGMDPEKVYAVPEAWTSIRCHRCGRIGVRPKQSYFLCPTCGYRDNADKNAAINIARRLIMLIPSLRDENRGLGMWVVSLERALPTAGGSTRSDQMSPLLVRSPASEDGESVADCRIEPSPEGSGDSTDPAMARTVETPSAAVTTGGLSAQAAERDYDSTEEEDSDEVGQRSRRSVELMPHAGW